MECSVGGSNYVVVPARAGGVTTGESFANFADFSVFSTSVISTGGSPVAGTPDTRRGPTLITVVAVPERGPGTVVGGISSLEGNLAFFEGLKVE